MFNSRFTPNVTGDKISLSKGEKVKYQLNNGNLIEAIIDSERMSHSACKNLGYEIITLKNNQRTFIDGKKIVWWSGKVDSIEQINRLLKTK